MTNFKYGNILLTGAAGALGDQLREPLSKACKLLRISDKEILNKTFVISLANPNSQIIYYLLMILILLFFLKSVNFKPLLFLKYSKFLYNFLLKKREKNYTNCI